MNGWVRSAATCARVAAAVPVVVVRRTVVLSTASPARRRREAVRMVQEKAEAVGEILQVLAGARGSSPEQLTRAVIEPISRRVLANQRRLTRR